MENNHLEDVLRELEDRVANMEAIALGFKNIEERFVMGVLNEFFQLLETSSSRAADHLPLDKDDLFQEIILYMLKWNLPKAKKFSTLQELWLPYIKASIRNCFKNIKDYHMCASRLGTEVSYESLCDNSTDRKNDTSRDVLDKIFVESFNPEDELIGRELIYAIIHKLTSEEKRVFRFMVKPPKKFIREITKINPTGSSRVTKTSISKYLKISYPNICGIFQRIHICYEEALLEV